MEFIAFLISGVIFWLICLYMLLPHKINKKTRDAISRFGLIHFTTEKSAEEIINSSVIKSSKISKILHCSYFFQNGTVAMDAISHNNLESKKSCIEILNLTEKQLDHLWIRYYDMAVICFDDFNFSKTNQVLVKSEHNISSVKSNLPFCLKIAILMAVIGGIAISFYFVMSLC